MQELQRFLGSSDLPSRPALQEQFRDQPEVRAELARTLQRSGERRDWLTFHRAVVIAAAIPSPMYVPALCEVLDKRIDEVNNEDIADVLGLIGDPRAVACLSRALEWPGPDWDDAFGLAQKCIMSLIEIGTPDAIAVVDALTVSPIPEIAEHARVWRARLA